jgi:hypothetical protein
MQTCIQARTGGTQRTSRLTCIGSSPRVGYPRAGKCQSQSSGWGHAFDEPIALPDGRKLILLRDAASYITALPKEADAPEWQAAIEALMLVVELSGPTMMARIGVMQALNRHHGRVFNPSQKAHHWGRRKLKGDQ